VSSNEQAPSGASRLRPFVKETTVDRVTAELRRSILAGELQPGKPFTIAEISEVLEISASPVREALRRLEMQGLVEMRASRRAIVPPIDLDDLREIYSLRKLLEVDLIGRSAKFLTDEDVATVEEVLTHYREGSPDPDKLLDQHHELHLALLRPGATKWELRVLEMLWHANERYVRLVYSNAFLEPDRARHLAEVHEPLLEAARSRSPRQLRAVQREHLEHNERTMLDALQRLV
jgi:DNA-binding GntR family transcriptional regulator